MSDDSIWALRHRQKDWAGRYDGEARLAGGADAGALARLIEPARREWASTGRVPTWCGVDFLRGWASHLVSADREANGVRLQPGGSSEGEFSAVLAAVNAHPRALGPDRPPLTLGPLTIPMPSKQLEALIGDNDPWNRHLVTAWRACASPGLVEPPPRPVPVISENYDVDGMADRIAFLSPLLPVLMFGLGWSRMDLGLSRWLELGRPTEEPVLDAVQRWWGDDVEGFIAWLVLNPHIIATFQTGLMGERAPALGDVDDSYAALRSDPRWKVVWSGPGDSMHLKDHVVAPLTPTNSENFCTSPELDKDGVPRVAMVTSSYAGWYDALRALASPTRVQGRDVRVDVTCTPIGWLGQFRRSTVTGLWFRGPHALHMLGN